MTSKNYEHIALNWQPDNSDNRRFLLIVAIVLGLSLLLAMTMSMINVPDEPRQQTKVSDRVAQFIKKKPKPKKVEAPKPKAKPKPPPPKPKVARKKDEPKKPLTKVQQEARKKAEKSGILALSEEFADLIDSSAVDAAVAVGVSNEQAGRNEVAGLSTDAIINSTGKGSGGVSGKGLIASVGGTQLAQAQLAQVKQSLIKGEVVNEEDEPVSQDRGDNVRSEEEVQIVFDRNKGRLQSIYLRERRKDPGLEGTIIFEITIAPEGNVTNIRIVSSELNNANLERRLVARIKGFKFSTKSVEPVTVTFPIEFLP